VKLLELILFLAGLVLLIVLVAETGLDRLTADISLIGWGFLLVLTQEFIPHTANTLGWIFATSPSRRSIPFTQLLAYRLAGDGINHLTPTATLGGEFIRTRLVLPRLGVEEGTASVTIAKFAETAGQVIFIAGGLVAVLPFLPGLGPYRWWMFAIVTAALVGIGGLAWMLQYGLFTIAARVLSFPGFTRKWFASHSKQIEEIDLRIRHCLQTRPLDLVMSIACFTFAFGASVIEVWLILKFLGLPAPWTVVLGVEVLSVLIEAVLFFVPMKMGIQEGGKMLIFKILAMDPVKGLAMGVIRRGRELFWALVGLCIYVAVRAQPDAPAAGAEG